MFDKDQEPSTTVSFAVRASISIPGLFKPMSRVSQRQELVDGGLLLNLPVELLYSRAQKENCALIGVRFKQPLKYFESPKVWEIAQATINLMMRRGSLPPQNIAQDPNYIDIEIDVSGFDTLTFDLTNAQKEELVRRGSAAAKLALAQYEARIRHQVSTQNLIVIPNNLLSSYPRGQVHFDSAYVKREPDESRCYREILQPGALIRIKAPLQMGKTLLMSKILEQADKHGFRTVALNLREGTPKDFSNLDTFLQWFCTSVSVKLELTQPVDEHWSRSVGNSKIKCRTYFERYLLPGESPLALALDEVDKLFLHPEIAGEFLGMLRTWHEDAKTRELWRHMRLVVLHTEVYTQIDINQSPFNAGTEIKLTDFSQRQVQDLAQQYGLNWNITQVQQLMDMIGGHPYLVAKALEQVARLDMALEHLLETASSENGIYRDHLRQHLTKLKNNPQLAAELKKVVIANDVNPVKLNLDLNPDLAVKLDELGLVKLQNNQAKPRYKLYSQYFRNRL